MTTPAQLEEAPFTEFRVLRKPAALRPCLVVDTREQTPLPFLRLPSVTATLATGDYSFRGGEQVFSVERKSVPDLLGCCCGGRERFERELARLRGYRFARLLIIGTIAEVETGNYHAQVAPAAVMHSLASWEVRYSVPVVWAQDPAAGGRLVESWAYWFARETVTSVNNVLRAMKGDP